MEKFTTESVFGTEQVAAQFAKTLKKGDVVAFFGSMGMGKTAFTRGLIEGLGGKNMVSSPTFALVNEYELENFTVYHFDMYRVTSQDDLYSTGFFDYLDTDAILIIEWSENIIDSLPKNIIQVNIIQGSKETTRIIEIVRGDETY